MLRRYGGWSHRGDSVQTGSALRERVRATFAARRAGLTARGADGAAVFFRRGVDVRGVATGGAEHGERCESGEVPAALHVRENLHREPSVARIGVECEVLAT